MQDIGGRSAAKFETFVEKNRYVSTLKDISQELGLSVATISRALNGFPEVNARTRAKVEETAKRLNYQPNRLAQKLKSGRSGQVGMIVRPDPKNPSDRGFVEIMLGLSQELARHDLDMVFQVQLDSNPLTAYQRLVGKNTVDGFILNAPMQDDPRIAYLQENHIPFVVHGRTGGAVDYPYFDIDNRRVGRDATRLLLNLGHRRIVFLNGPQNRSFAVERAAGFADEIAAHDLPAQTVLYDDQSADFGYRASLQLLGSRKEARPTAIFCSSTVLAEGVYRAAADLGLTIPAQLSVIAHDDAVPQLRAEEFSPSLSVTRSPLRDACAPLARILVETLNNPNGDRPQETAVAELIPRRSTAAPSKEIE